jgi:hypothetical protein
VTREEQWVVSGTREEHGEEVDIEVVIRRNDDGDWDVYTAYPTGGDGVRTTDGDGNPIEDE